MVFLRFFRDPTPQHLGAPTMPRAPQASRRGSKKLGHAMGRGVSAAATEPDARLVKGNSSDKDL